MNTRELKKDLKKNGLYRLKQIRLLLETNKSWELKKVMRALSVDRNVAVAILKKLGYTCRNGKWFFDDESIESLKMREEWLAQEGVEDREISRMTVEWFGE